MEECGNVKIVASLKTALQRGSSKSFASTVGHALSTVPKVCKTSSGKKIACKAQSHGSLHTVLPAAGKAILSSCELD